MKNTREEILASLQDQLDKLNENTGRYAQYNGTIEHPNGSMTECNFGGKLIILNNAGDGAVVWSDWADTAIDTELTEVEIDSFEDEEEDEEEDNRWKMGFKLNNKVYFLDQFMRI